MQSTGFPSTPSSRVAQRGLFRNGVWHCNCSPRLPAIRLIVRKDTPNKGRAFYTCQKNREKANKCDFFLWAEEATQREVGAVLSNSRSEAEDTPSRQPKRQRTIHESITPAKEKRHWSEKTPVTSISNLNRMVGISPSATAASSTVKGSPVAAQGMSPEELEKFFSSDEDDLSAPATNGASRPSATHATPSGCAKRKRPDVEEYSDLSSAEEEALVALANKSSSQSSQDTHRNAFETPASTKVATPTHVVKDGMPSPLTEKPVRRVLFADPQEDGNSNKKQQQSHAGGGLAASIHNRPLGTSPSSSQEAARTPGKDAPNVTQEVMALLEGQAVDGAVLRDVRAALDRHAARARGLERGHDASRDAARKAETRVAELRQRVTDLENQRRLDADARQKMRTDLMKLYRES
ncbi:hypothetical protein GGR52DRAFT_571205 [Hypoxylon sp. FL1284]|nr:hypothetical protein GGR52DRAFT_571205 [Hypoxylon sp. FL1284]